MAMNSLKVHCKGRFSFSDSDSSFKRMVHKIPGNSNILRCIVRTHPRNYSNFERIVHNDAGNDSMCECIVHKHPWSYQHLSMVHRNPGNYSILSALCTNKPRNIAALGAKCTEMLGIIAL